MTLSTGAVAAINAYWDEVEQDCPDANFDRTDFSEWEEISNPTADEVAALACDFCGVREFEGGVVYQP